VVREHEAGYGTARSTGAVVYRSTAKALVADTSISGIRVAREFDRLLVEHSKPGSVG
jgi:hypothetical protein